MSGEGRLTQTRWFNPADGNNHVNEDRSVYGTIANAYSRNAGVGSESDGTQHIYSIVPTRGGAGTAQTPTRRSGGPHSGVCMFVFCDGSVKPISNTISAVTIAAAGLEVPGVLLTGGPQRDSSPVAAGDAERI